MGGGDGFVPRQNAVYWAKTKITPNPRRSRVKLKLHVKNKLKLLKNRQFSNLDKSADMADINDQQVL